MKTYHIPNTDLEVSRIAFGTWHLGETWDTTPYTPEILDRADKLIHTAVDNGINFIDLADIYTWGKSDMLVGEVIKNDPSLRDKVILQEKAGIILPNEIHEGSPGYYDFSYENLTSKVERSLKRLNTDYVDILLLHRPDALVEPEEVARAFDHLQSSGKVKYFGVSNHNSFQIDLLKKYVDQPFVVNQVELSLLHNELVRDGLIFNNKGQHYTGAHGTLDYCRLNDMLIQPWSPVARGYIFAPNREGAPETAAATAAEIKRLAEKYDTTPEAIGLGWLLRHPAMMQPILGTMKPSRIVDTVKADDVELTKLEWYGLLQKAAGAGVP